MKLKMLAILPLAVALSAAPVFAGTLGIVATEPSVAAPAPPPPGRMLPPMSVVLLPLVACLAVCGGSSTTTTTGLVATD